MANIIKIIEGLEAERCLALIEADTGKLDELFSEKLYWCHSSGKVDTKEQLLAKIASGSTRYITMKRSDVNIVASKDGGAFSTGLVEMEANVAGTDHQLSNRYTTNWIEEDDGWKLVAWQSTKTPKD